MIRRGYIVVANDDVLFPSSVSEGISARAKAILEHIEADRSVRLTGIPFSITPQSQAGRTLQRLTKTLFANDERANVRIIYMERSSNPDVVNTVFADNPLLVTIEPSADELTTIQVGVGEANPCHIRVTPHRLPRLVEDLVVEITLANFFRKSHPVDQLIAEVGLRGMYASKARHYRTVAANGWIDSVTKLAGYAPLSSLSLADPDDLRQRGSDAFDAWAGFANSLTVKTVPIVAATLRSIPKIGGQLPIQRIAKSARALPDGTYNVAILKKSTSARKNPKLRSEVRSIFGKRSRPNSYKFMPTEYSNTRDIIKTLINNNYITVISVEITSGSLAITGGR